MRQPGETRNQGPLCSDFDRATAVTPHREDRSVFDAVLPDGWRVGAGINGGLLSALAARALSEELGGSGHRDPFALTAYFLSPLPPRSGDRTHRVGANRSSPFHRRGPADAIRRGRRGGGTAAGAGQLRRPRRAHR